MESPVFYTVTETAARAGHYRWVEQRLFELMGSWASGAQLDNEEAEYWVGTQSYHHEFLAELWAKRLSTLGFDPAPIAPSSQIDAALSIERWDAYSAAGKLAGLYRVLVPRIMSTYQRHLSCIDPMVDGPTARVLNLCLNDYRSDWAEGERVVQSALAQTDDIEDIYVAQQQVEKTFSSSPGLI